MGCRKHLRGTESFTQQLRLSSNIFKDIWVRALDGINIRVLHRVYKLNLQSEQNVSCDTTTMEFCCNHERNLLHILSKKFWFMSDLRKTPSTQDSCANLPDTRFATVKAPPLSAEHKAAIEDDETSIPLEGKDCDKAVSWIPAAAKRIQQQTGSSTFLLEFSQSRVSGFN